MLAATNADPSDHDHPPQQTRLPLLCSKARACAEWGDIGNTAFYQVCRAHNVALIHIGSKTAVSGADVARVAAEIMAASKPPVIDAKALAQRSVAARQSRRSAQPKRRRRGDHAP